MTIGLASDHAGHALKDALLGFLRDKGLTVLDYGCAGEEAVDYPDFAEKAVRGILAGECERAILVCGTGMGMSIVANKFRGIRATPCWSPYTAEVSRRHNDANVLALGGRVLSPEEAFRIAAVWVETPFDGGRHERRLDKIRDVESRACGS